MELKETLKFIKKEFPDKSIDISESMGLLADTIDDLMSSINDKIKQMCSKRDFESAEKYINIGKIVNEYEDRISKIINFTNVNQDEKSLPDYEKYFIDNRMEHTLYENFTHIRPYGFKIGDENLIEVKTWQEMFLKTCEILFKKDENKFMQFENEKCMNGKKVKYFSLESSYIRKPVKILDKIYVETNLSSNSIRDIIIKMLKEYKINIACFKVYFRADYTKLNKR